MNTSKAEQIFSWFRGYASTFNSMDAKPQADCAQLLQGAQRLDRHRVLLPPQRAQREQEKSQTQQDNLRLRMLQEGEEMNLGASQC